MYCTSVFLCQVYFIMYFRRALWVSLLLCVMHARAGMCSRCAFYMRPASGALVYLRYAEPGSVFPTQARCLSPRHAICHPDALLSATVRPRVSNDDGDLSRAWAVTAGSETSSMARPLNCPIGADTYTTSVIPRFAWGGYGRKSKKNLKGIPNVWGTKNRPMTVTARNIYEKTEKV